MFNKGIASALIWRCASLSLLVCSYSFPPTPAPGDTGEGGPGLPCCLPVPWLWLCSVRDLWASFSSCCRWSRSSYGVATCQGPGPCCDRGQFSHLVFLVVGGMRSRCGEREKSFGARSSWKKTCRALSAGSTRCPSFITSVPSCPGLPHGTSSCRLRCGGRSKKRRKGRFFWPCGGLPSCSFFRCRRTSAPATCCRRSPP